eukprot:111081-Ditylum_brightwellii.AAC.1
MGWGILEGNVVKGQGVGTRAGVRTQGRKRDHLYRTALPITQGMKARVTSLLWRYNAKINGRQQGVGKHNKKLEEAKTKGSDNAKPAASVVSVLKPTVSWSATLLDCK